jgi:hypothetical protein
VSDLARRQSSQTASLDRYPAAIDSDLEAELAALGLSGASAEPILLPLTD